MDPIETVVSFFDHRPLPDLVKRSRELWSKRAKTLDIACDFHWLDYLIENHYYGIERAMRFCHVNDLLGQVREYAEFQRLAAKVTDDSLEMAVKKYFSTLSLGISEISFDFLY